MFLSRPLRYVAMGSCVIHILVLGLAEVIKLREVRYTPNTLKVALHFQEAGPLPVGNLGAPGVGTPPPLSVPTVAAPPPPPKPVPKAKPVSSLPAAAKPKPPPKPQPAVIATTAPTEAPPVPAWPAAAPPEDGGKAENAETGGGGAGTSGGKGTGGSGGKAGTGVGGGSGHGGGGGTSAHPDYGVNPKPPYPMVARRMGIQGVVLLRVHVRADGGVAAAELAHSSGSPLLDDSALKTVRGESATAPARLDGTPVESWVEVPIRFVLDAS